jgi:hypothetical protein
VGEPGYWSGLRCKWASCSGQLSVSELIPLLAGKVLLKASREAG